MSDRSVLTQTEISNGRKWLPRLPVDTPGSEETFHLLPNLLRQKMVLDNIPRCIITQRIVQCGSFFLTWLGSKWIKIRAWHLSFPQLACPMLESLLWMQTCLQSSAYECDMPRRDASLGWACGTPGSWLVTELPAQVTWADLGGWGWDKNKLTYATVLL